MPDRSRTMEWYYKRYGPGKLKSSNSVYIARIIDLSIYKVPTNPVPAVAVIQRGQAFGVLTGLTAHVGCYCVEAYVCHCIPMEKDVLPYN